MEDVVIIVPSYNPDKEIMMEFMQKLKSNFANIVVVNDGCKDEYNTFFEELNNQGFVVLKHYINFGKGRGIKTAFNYVLNNYPDAIGAITADCDGQHHLEDIINCANKLKEKPDKLIIGCRSFDERQVPFRSRLGNKLTRFMFNAFVGIKITDTQSGLRGFSRKIMEAFLKTAGERYEYETNMLIDCKEKDIKIEEVPISTIYIRNNALSHFNVLRDSARIYKLFLKYIIASLSSFILDILLFTVFVNLSLGIIASTIIARVISALYNFAVNSKVVFKNKNADSIIKYFILCIIQMLVSAFVVWKVFDILHINSTIIKIVVDTIIFIVNFVIQREWVFANKGKM